MSIQVMSFQSTRFQKEPPFATLNKKSVTEELSLELVAAVLPLLVTVMMEPRLELDCLLARERLFQVSAEP